LTINKYLHVLLQGSLGIRLRAANKHIYCNVDDEALLDNGPVTQQWKGSDRCYAMDQHTGVNNGVEDVFSGRCGGYITVTEQSSKNTTGWQLRSRPV
jgi:hypothetical protein